MDFNNGKPIYLQMCDSMMDEILAGKYLDEERIPSVRDFAISLGVNTNTAMKAYDELSRNDIIYNKRGLGYFVSAGACERIKAQRRKEFLEATIPQLQRQMKMLGMTIVDLTAELRKREDM